MAVDPQNVLAMMALLEEEAEFEAVLLAAARQAAAEIMAVEEGVGLGTFAFGRDHRGLLLAYFRLLT